MTRLNKELLNTLPQNIIEDVKGTLKAYDKVTVLFENGEYKATTGCMLKNVYPEDFKVIGDFYKEDIFTENDMIINYIEEFHSYPTEYKGQKDWDMIQELSKLRNDMKIGKIELDNKGKAFIKSVEVMPEY